MATTLVTGANGFIGSQLVRRLLEQGDRVRCLVRRTSRLDGLPTDRVELVYGDVCQADDMAAAVGGVDVVYHLAGLVKSLNSKQLFAVNVGGVENVAAACAAQPTPPVLLFVSSLAAAGPSPQDRARTEVDTPRPVSHYGESKRLGELAAQRFADRVPITIVRPPAVIGEGDPLGISLFRPIARWGIHPVPGLTDWRMSMIHVADLAEALVRLAANGERILPTDANDSAANSGQGCYFVADEAQLTYAEIGKLIGRSLGRRRIRVVHLPGMLVWAAAALAELGAQAIRRANIFNLDKAREATAGSWTCSPGSIRQRLGFTPACPLEERLAQTAHWYREHGWF